MIRGGDCLRRYNYFDDEDNIVIKPKNDAFKKLKNSAADKSGAFVSFFREKLDEIETERENAFPVEPEEQPPSAESAVLPPNPPEGKQADPLSEDDIEIAIKAFSHKSGDRATVIKPVEKIKAVAETVIENNPIEAIEKVSRGKRFLITLGLCLFTIVFFIGVIAVFMHSINAENNRIQEFNANAGEVCADYIMNYGSTNYENLYNNYGIEGYRLTGLCFARELDFDGDGKSELMLCYNKNGEYYNDVWGYNGSGEFELLFSNKAAQSEDKTQDVWATLYYNNNKYMIGVHDSKDITKVDMYQLQGSKFKKKMSCTYDTVTESYVVNNKIDATSFERIKLSVLRVEKAIVSTDQVSKTLEGFSGTESVTAQPGTAQTLETAYYSIVQEYNKRYGTAEYKEKDGSAYVDGLAVVELIDFDDDDQKELLLVYRKEIKVRDENSKGEHVTKAVDEYYCDVYRYNGTRAVLAYSNEGISSSPFDAHDLYYMLKKADGGYHYCVTTASASNYGRELYASSTELEFNGTEFKSTLSLAYETQYGYSEYYLEDDSVKKSVFDETSKGIPFFAENSKDYDEDTYLITYVQRKTSNAGEVKSIPEKTEKAIKELNAQYSAN